MPNNFPMARGSLNGLKKRLLANKKYKEDYSEYMTYLIEGGMMEKVPRGEIRCPLGKCWYLVHHAVYHTTKNKIRIVFDCSRKSAGVSLNDILIGGPDLLNSLVGVLLRFREERYPVMGDIEKNVVAN